MKRDASSAAVAQLRDAKVGLLVVSVNRTYPRLNAYDAARYAWRLSPERARQIHYVLATKNRHVIGVFEPTEWKPATLENFPEFDRQMRGRLGFIGRAAKKEAAAPYLDRDLPAEFRFSGNGYRYAGSLAS